MQLVGASGVDRAHRFIIILLALQRLSYLVPAVLSTGSDAFHNGMLNVALVVATIAWNVVLFWDVKRRGWFSPALVWGDVLFAAALIVVVSHNAGESYGHSSVNWSGRIAQAAAALAGAAVGPLLLAAAAVAVLLGAHTVGVSHGLAGSGEFAPELISCLNGLFWFAVIIGFCARYLRRQGSTLDRLTEERLVARTRQAADSARYAARIGHYRALHDTVLSTLAAIARGGLDHRSAQVRQRCAREADYVRRLMLTDDVEATSPLGDRLGEVASDAEALGLRVHYRLDPLDRPVPDNVAEAVSGAAREALNNVAKHSGTRSAWLTATSVDDAVLVRVVDRGSGFAADAQPGFGLPFSVADRMREVGGSVRVTSAPADGTCVELIWPA